MMIKLLLSLLCFMAFVKLSVSAQEVNQAFLRVEGEVSRPLRLALLDLKKMSSAEVYAKDKKGKEHKYRGVRLADVLLEAGVPLGKELRGKNLTKYLLMTAKDGYKVIYSLPEIDPEFTNDVVLLAYEVDGQPLPADDGPYRIVAPGARRQARWIRQIELIKVVTSVE